ncbi:unnamed protein product [Larinioides sclopetarius]|uniref:Uncharacterized protein n=1 Tax=Larinioides sclopetarius TaxID=280406 RepID=A0AAV1YRM0_9ARAC
MVGDTLRCNMACARKTPEKRAPSKSFLCYLGTKDRVRLQAPTATTRPLLVRCRCHARTIECLPESPSGAPFARGVATTFQRNPPHPPPTGPQTVRKPLF